MAEIVVVVVAEAAAAAIGITMTIVDHMVEMAVVTAASVSIFTITVCNIGLYSVLLKGADGYT